MNLRLNEVERRVLGVLIEKSMTQADYYPMTLNSIVTASNQKSNRDPMMDLDDSAVWSALDTLREMGLVARILPPPGSRADKFKHDAAGALGWQSAHRAIMTELLLRGPQTVGELRTRCARMHSFSADEDVPDVLARLQEWDPPQVVVLARQPGQSAARYTHCLAAETDDGVYAPAGGADGAEAAVRPAPPADSVAVASAPSSGELEALQEEIGELHETIRELESRVAALERRLGA